MRPEGEPGISGGFYILKYQVSISPQFRVRALLLVMLLNNWGGGHPSNSKEGLHVCVEWEGPLSLVRA